MNALESSKIYKIGLYIVMGISFSILATQLLLRVDNIYLFLTASISFVCGIFFVRKTHKDVFSHIKSHKLEAIFVIYMCACVIWEVYVIKGIPLLDYVLGLYWFKILKAFWLVACMPALSYILIYSLIRVGVLLTDIFSKLSSQRKKSYLIMSVILFVCLCFFYTENSEWYLSWTIYGMDSGWCYEEMFTNIDYYDIRHVTFSIISFPLYIIVKIVVSMFAPQYLVPLLTIICVQFVNVQMLLLVGLMIGEMSESKWVYYLYLASLPTILYSFAFEKYQVCVFLLVLYVYQRFIKNKDANISMIMATGTMTTSILLVFDELIEQKTIREKAINMLKMGLMGICFLICTGRIFLFNIEELFRELSGMAAAGGDTSLAINQCFNSYTNFIKGIFLPITSTIGTSTYGPTYVWVDIINNISVLGCVFVVVMMIGVYTCYKNRFIKTCAVWGIISIWLFFVVRWGIWESPLFSIYFSWAFIPMFQKGFQWIINKFNVPEKVAYGSLITAMLVVNFLTVLDINMFMKNV